MLARLLRLEDLVEVRVPSVAQAAGQDKSLLTATLAVMVGAVGVVAVALLGWAFGVLWRPDSTPGWYDGMMTALFTLAIGVAGFTARRLATWASRRP